MHPIQTFEEMEIGGYKIPKASYVATCHYSIMRSPEYWDNPEDFNPERFLKEIPMKIPENSGIAPSMIFTPFLQGPHACIGKYLALNEIVLVLPSILKHYEINLVADQPIKPRSSVTLRPSTAVMVRAHRRKSL